MAAANKVMCNSNGSNLRLSVLPTTGVAGGSPDLNRQPLNHQFAICAVSRLLLIGRCVLLQHGSYKGLM